jgi:hypothetical protein
MFYNPTLLPDVKMRDWNRGRLLIFDNFRNLSFQELQLYDVLKKVSPTAFNIKLPV